MQLQISQIDCRNSRYCRYRRNCEYHKYTAEIAELFKWETENPHTCGVTEYPATRKHSPRMLATRLRSGWGLPSGSPLLNFLSVFCLKWLRGYVDTQWMRPSPLPLKISKSFYLKWLRGYAVDEIQNRTRNNFWSGCAATQWMRPSPRFPLPLKLSKRFIWSGYAVDETLLPPPPPFLLPLKLS